MKKNKLGSADPCSKWTEKRIKDLNIKAKTRKLLEGVSFVNLEFGNVFLDIKIPQILLFFTNLISGITFNSFLLITYGSNPDKF